MKKILEKTNRINQVSENQKLDLFNIEELEDRLEMATLFGKPDHNGLCWHPH